MPTKTLDQYLTELSDATSLAASDQLLLQRGNVTHRANIGDVLLNYHGFIDPHKFGAKGDTVKYSDGIAYAGGTEFGSVSHIFKPEDVGKVFYTDAAYGRLTVSGYISPNRITLSGTSAFGSEQTGRFWIMGTDDTAALRAALAAAARNRGGGIAGGLASGSRNQNYGSVVMLRPDSRYLVRNTAADLAAGRTAALEIPQRCGLVGLAGVRNASIMAVPDNSGHVVANLGADQFNDFLTVANFTIDGLSGLGSYNNSQDCLHLEIAFDGYVEVDAFHNVFNVDTREARRHGIYIEGRGEGVYSNIRAIGAKQTGIYIARSMDSTYIAVNAGGSKKTGIRIDATTACRFVGGKSFYSGASGGAVAGDCAGWWATSDMAENGGNQYIGCESQESRGSGFLIETGRSHLVGCKVADPGRLTIASGTLPAVRAGYAIGGALARHNTLVGCVVQPDLGVWADGQRDVVQNETQQPDRSKRNWGWGTDSVNIDGNATGTRGEVWTDPLTDYDTGFGAVGGAGASNGKNTKLRVDGTALT